jgi:hypothetical protein
MVLLVGSEMVGEMVDARREDRDLDRRAPPVLGVELVLLDDVFFLDTILVPPRESTLIRKRTS